jgi:hypothetical protein
VLGAWVVYRVLCNPGAHKKRLLDFPVGMTFALYMTFAL